MSCTIVIPHKDRPTHLRWTLRSLKAQKTDHNFEVVVVDDGSEVRPQTQLSRADLPDNTRFIHQNNAGAGSARNAGWKTSKKDIIIFLDCDQIVSPSFINAHMQPFLDDIRPFMQLGTRRQLVRDAKLDLNAMDKLTARPDERIQFWRKTSFNFRNLAVGWHLGFSHNMSFRRRDLELYGGFDENFTGWGFEDCELTYRMQKNGVLPVLTLSALAYHQFHVQGMTGEKFKRWRLNLNYFIDKYPCSDVSLQEILAPIVDPMNKGPVSWQSGLLHMETIARLKQGRELQGLPTNDVECNSLEDAQKLVKRKDSARIRALLPSWNPKLFHNLQLNPEYSELRIFFR